MKDKRMNHQPSVGPVSVPSTRTEGTSVVRVPFGVRRAKRTRPERKPSWVTLVLPLQAASGGHPTPPHAA